MKEMIRLECHGRGQALGRAGRGAGLQDKSWKVYGVRGKGWGRGRGKVGGVARPQAESGLVQQVFHLSYLINIRISEARVPSYLTIKG